MSKKYGFPCENPGQRTSRYPLNNGHAPRHACIACAHMVSHIRVPPEPPICGKDGKTCESHEYGKGCSFFEKIKRD